MKRVAIVGGGFAGVSAARRLARHAGEITLTLIDKSASSQFLPCLPDVIGRGLSPEVLRYPQRTLGARLGYEFVQEEVAAVDLEHRRILTPSRQLAFDYVLIAGGSETNFYGDARVRERAFKLDDTDDAERLRQQFETRSFRAYIIAGAGYTGVEIATSLRRALRKRSLDSPIVMIEKAPQILGPLPDWMKSYVLRQLTALNIQVMTNTSLSAIDETTITLSNNRRFPDAMLVWAAGVKTPAFVQNMPHEKSPQGRLRVDDYLRVGEDCFAAGDSALFTYRGGTLRMGVQFAIMQGELAAENILRSMKNQPLKKYRPMDFGYIIPMANNAACGNICGLNLIGITPILLHYLMCAYRSYGVRNRYGLLSGLELL